jgi:8-oxo-dGTP pyrophosphatase MutT (NUDIX family)
MNPSQIRQLQGALKRVTSATHSEDARHHASRVLSFIASESRPWSRATLAGHITASAWVLDRTYTHAVLIHHRKLDRWFQPGGHVEDSDEGWRAAAQREVTEETGLTQFVPRAADEEIFDVDVHPIPERKDEPAHFHYDLRFLFVADVDATVDHTLMLNADEAHDCRWFALADLASDPAIEPSLRRMVELSIQRFPVKNYS